MIVVQQTLNFLPTIIVFKSEEPVYIRERQSRLYHIWIYATSKMIAEFPTLLMVPLMMNLLLYFAIGFDDKFETFFKFYLTLVLMVQAAVAMGYFVSSIFRAESTAVAFAPIFNMPVTLLGGFMISLKGIHQETP